jgi:hypothetical protein
MKILPAIDGSPCSEFAFGVRGGSLGELRSGVPARRAVAVRGRRGRFVELLGAAGLAGLPFFLMT